MADVYKTSNMFQLTTIANDPQWAVPHTGGWSESYWSLTNPLVVNLSAFTAWRIARAKLLPAQAAIIGYRVQRYNMIGNQLMALGSQVGTVANPGVGTNVTDLPQVALQLVVGNAGSPNKANMTLRGIPDSQMVGGEYTPTPTFVPFLAAFRAQLITSTFGFVGRDKSQASVQVLSLSQADGILVNAIPATGLVAGDWVRLNRVVSSTGASIVGPYRVTSVVGNIINVLGLGGLVVNKPGGTLRRDQLVFVQYGQTFLRRAVVKKVGSPFEKYRGRRSKRKV